MPETPDFDAPIPQVIIDTLPARPPETVGHGIYRMPETPDFDAIAETCVRYVESHMLDVVGSVSSNDPVRGTVVRRIAEQLRQIWNARGAADIAILESYGYAQHLAAELRTVDR
jgi:hypothetical protein